jgi:hypothetical protein
MAATLAFLDAYAVWYRIVRAGALGKEGPSP